eukprot:scaffold29530_cov42-Cyclotella_meneghiniana.AAC.1
MRYSRTRPGTMYLGSTAVCCDEAMKLITCLLILTFGYYCKEKDGGGEYSQLSIAEREDDDIRDEEEDDNIEQAVKIDDEDATTLFGHLRKELQFDWRMGGLALLYTIQKLDKVEENASKSYQEQKRWVGVLAVLGACCTSGFGGVYFELVLKPRPNSDSGTPPPSVWAKNVQLSMFALMIALITAFIKDHKAILQNGFFQGYSPLVVLVITLEAGGGLVVAAVIKYADNILKSFATAVSIVTSTIVSMVVFGFVISQLFIGGSLLVFIAIYMYQMAPDPPTRTEQLPSQTSEIAMMARNNESEKGINK